MSHPNNWRNVNLFFPTTSSGTFNEIPESKGRVRKSFLAAVISASMLLMLFALPSLAAVGTVGSPDCPAGTTYLVKFQWDGSKYVVDQPDDFKGDLSALGVTITGDAESFDWASADSLIDTVIVLSLIHI